MGAVDSVRRTTCPIEVWMDGRMRCVTEAIGRTTTLLDTEKHISSQHEEITFTASVVVVVLALADNGLLTVA